MPGMEPRKQAYAIITDGNFRQARDGFPIQSEREAVEKTLAAHGIYFHTYEITSVEINGKVLKSDPENRSPRNFVGISRVYTRDEAIEERIRAATSTGNPDIDLLFNENSDSLVRYFKKQPADAVFITGLERDGEYIRLEKGEKVFDGRGRQLWPALPVPSVKAAPPANKDRWKLR